ncbi:transposase [Streptomyces sp. TRM70350]|uniref:transposase n=1 Tax=Streptomyces sp. TRM70350 TaxID=2856165 RepID=UPI002110A336|nr:transposase [Streptomyces sp. TRM70350]
MLDLSDRQAAEAVRCRIDFKYVLAMELDDPGFHHNGIYHVDTFGESTTCTPIPSRHYSDSVAQSVDTHKGIVPAIRAMLRAAGDTVKSEDPVWPLTVRRGRSAEGRSPMRAALSSPRGR